MLRKGQDISNIDVNLGSDKVTKRLSNAIEGTSREANTLSDGRPSIRRQKTLVGSGSRDKSADSYESGPQRYQSFETEPEAEGQLEEFQSLYLTPNGKFDILNEYFGISSLPLPPCAGNERQMKKAIKKLKKSGALISGDFERLCQVISTLKSQNEVKKNAKEAEQYLVPLLEEKVFFKKKYPMPRKDMIELCNFAKYEVIEAGETIYKQGDLADKCYIILKGQVSVQILDPTGEGLLVVKEPVVEEEEVVQVQEDDDDEEDKVLTKEQLLQLPQREQQRHRTRMMLDDILRSHNYKKSKNSLCKALNQHSKIADFVRLDPPAKPKTLAEQFNEKIKRAATKLIHKNEDDGEEQKKDFLQILKEQNEEEDAFLTDKINLEETELDDQSLS